ncbi:GNAT family N-acetyltransferase [Actinophytocola oryzae]|uniref:Acetyltransferase (GNAT) family protein n=1 Tax=Actinophytocola oryzae TaxID=502181 RepID=A0A4R7UXV8_9PSEU|nr:GNAT family protein [Actinophytocola oryzae]TDV41350.1 acetyltransferase (GNAT) family protein [Actinophytocola oryzae]
MSGNIIAPGDGVALTDLTEEDRASLAERGDHAYDVDQDDRPVLHMGFEVFRAGVVDTETGTLVGEVNWHAVGYGRSAACTAWNVGISLLPDRRGKGTGAKALRLLVEHLFATTEVDRIEASTDRANIPSQRALVKAGFRREGVLRGAQLRGGQRRDMLGFSILRDELRPVRTVLTSGDGVTLATALPEDRARLSEGTDHAFDPDPDDRPVRHGGYEIHRAAILDEETDTLVGQMSWHPVGYGHTAGCTAWNFGITLLPHARGRGFGATAIRLLVAHLFATTDVDRVEASTDRENTASRKALEKAGLRREGVLRGAQLRLGERRDMISYSILRDDLPADDAEREIVASGEGIELGDLLPGERELLKGQDDDAFGLDPDDRPLRHEPDVSRLAVLDQHTGELLGAVSWHAVGYGATAACEAWNIGIGLLPQSRGRGAGTVATRLVAEFLFATTDVDRVEAGTDRENIPAQRALAKAGFRPEGLLRGAQLRGGRRRDMLAFSLLRTDVVEAITPGVREVVVSRDGISLAEPAPGDREKFYIAGAGDFAIDPDDRPRVTGPTRSFLLSVIDSETGELLGGVSWHAVDYGGTVSSSAWNIGIGLLPEARGRGVGTIAQRMLVDHLLASTDLDRIEASTDVDNVAERKALEKAGFLREGVLRGAQLRGGIRRDLVHYGLVRGDVSN